jgi:hypothetical protein
MENGNLEVGVHVGEMRKGNISAGASVGEIGKGSMRVRETGQGGDEGGGGPVSGCTVMYKIAEYHSIVYKRDKDLFT